VILADGFFAGSWRLPRVPGRPPRLDIVANAAYDGLPHTARGEVEEEGRRLAAFLRPDDPPPSLHFARRG